MTKVAFWLKSPIEYLPLASVITPFVVVFSTMFTPGNGLPFSSVIVPLTLVTWANSWVAHITERININILFIVSILYRDVCFYHNGF